MQLIEAPSSSPKLFKLSSLSDRSLTCSLNASAFSMKRRRHVKDRASAMAEVEIFILFRLVSLEGAPFLSNG